VRLSGQQFPYIRKKILRDLFVAVGVGVNPVRQIHIGHAGHSIQQEGGQFHFVFGREVRIERFKFLCVGVAVIRRRFHAHQQHADLLRLRHFNRCRQIFLRFGRIQSTQRIIGAQRQNHNIRFGFEMPLQSRCRAGAG